MMNAADAIEPVAALVARRTGLFFPDSRRYALAAAIANAFARTRARSAGELVQLLDATPAAFDELVAELTIHESYFFRYPGHFEVLRQEVLPEILRRRGQGHRLRLLSLGCAAGEEPYSLALLLDQEGLSGSSAVIGTDISRPSLARAGRAVYGNWSLRTSTEEFRSRYFHREGERFRLVQRIRDRVELTYLNLAESFPSSYAVGSAGAFDVIFCRNALIYFDAASVAGAAARLFSALAEGGWLFTAAADPPLTGHAPFATVITPAGLLYRRPHGFTAQCETAAPTFDPQARQVLEREPRPTPLVVPRVQELPRGHEPPALRIRALADGGRIVEALEAAVTASRQEPNSAELHYLRAVLLSETGREREAADVLRRVLYLDGQLAVAALALGLSLRRLGDQNGARRALGGARALLASRPADEPVPLADGEIAGSLLRTIDVQIRFLGEA
jgi:chemotaxis protein methyltransferase CheR